MSVLDVLYWFASSGKRALEVALAIVAITAAFVALDILREPSDVQLGGRVFRLIDGERLSALPSEKEVAEGGAEVIQTYNALVTTDGTSNPLPGDIDLVTLDPERGSEGTLSALRGQLGGGIEGIVRFSLEFQKWVHEMQGDVDTIETDSAWKAIESCDRRVEALEDHYGPVACTTPDGLFRALNGSPGIPRYAGEFAALLEAQDLRQVLLEIEGRLPGEVLAEDSDSSASSAAASIPRSGAFYFEARLEVRNDGDGDAEGVTVIVPTGYVSVQAEENACFPDPTVAIPSTTTTSASVTSTTLVSGGGSSSIETAGFGVGSKKRCEVVFESPRMSRAELETVRPAFRVTKQESALPNLDSIPWLLIGLGLVAYFFIDLLWHRPNRTANGG